MSLLNHGLNNLKRNGIRVVCRETTVGCDSCWNLTAASFSVLVWLFISARKKSSEAGDCRLDCRNETACCVSSSSCSSGNAGSTLERSSYSNKDAGATGGQSRDLSVKMEDPAPMAEAGLSWDGKSVAKVASSKCEEFEFWHVTSKLSMRESKLSGCCWGLSERSATGTNDFLLEVWSVSGRGDADDSCAMALILRMVRDKVLEASASWSSRNERSLLLYGDDAALALRLHCSSRWLLGVCAGCRCLEYKVTSVTLPNPRWRLAGLRRRRSLLKDLWTVLAKVSPWRTGVAWRLE